MPDLAATALPETFVMTFADVFTQRPVGERGHFDPVTGEGSVIVPNLTPGLHPVAATCVIPDPDRLPLAITAANHFLQDAGVPLPLPPDFDFIAFLTENAPDLIAEMMVPKALGVQFFTVLAQPETKDECKKGGWRNFEGLGFKNQGNCIQFVNTGKRPTTTTTPTTSTTTTTMGSPSGAFLEDPANLLD